jgi:ABC-type oligopeptide transport system substrate-binding subunit
LPLTVIEGWFADYAHPSDFFEPLLVCGVGPEPGVTFCDPHLDHLVQTAQTTQGLPAIAAWQAADREAVNQAAMAPLTNLGGFDVISHRVGNYQRNPQLGEILDQLWVR